MLYFMLLSRSGPWGVEDGPSGCKPMTDTEKERYAEQERDLKQGQEDYKVYVKANYGCPKTAKDFLCW